MARRRGASSSMSRSPTPSPQRRARGDFASQYHGFHAVPGVSMGPGTNEVPAGTFHAQTIGASFHGGTLPAFMPHFNVGFPGGFGVGLGCGGVGDVLTTGAAGLSLAAGSVGAVGVNCFLPPATQYMSSLTGTRMLGAATTPTVSPPVSEPQVQATFGGFGNVGAASDGCGVGVSGDEWVGTPFADTIGEARRRAERARRQMEEGASQHGWDDEQQPQHDGPSPATQEELMEFQLRLTQFPQLDSRALGALNQLVVSDAIKALKDLEAKGREIRNPSAWILRTASNLRERSKTNRGGQPPPPPPEDDEKDAQEAHCEIVDHYTELEVADDADETMIKKAYRKLVLKWHPDKHPEDRDIAETKIRAINNAYETLSNGTKKEAYDAQRQAVQRKKRGLGPSKAAAMAPRQRIPREFMLQPIGFPDKFVRYNDDKARATCNVNARSDCKAKGLNGLEQFVPFFKAAKLSLWWLPEVNNMCRIRALEAATRSSAGEKVVAGRPGGLNLGFVIDVDHPSGQASDVKLMDAGKGERNENVNFIVVPSPLYDNAFRFEAAYRRGYFLAFQAPTSLLMVPYSGGELRGMVIDFTLVDFQAMFKFIDIEEVLRPVLESHSGWVPLDTLKRDTNVVAYFSNILQKPIWDDDDFQMYFEGHYEIWEFRAYTSGKAVRLRDPEERLAHALDRVRDVDDVACLIHSAGEELRRLSWRCATTSLAKLVRPGGSEDLSLVVQRMDAHRQILCVCKESLAAAPSEEISLHDLSQLAKTLQAVSANPSLSPDVHQRAADTSSVAARLVIARLSAEKRGCKVSTIPLTDLRALLALPGMSAQSDLLTEHLSPPLMEAPTGALLEALAEAHAGEAAPLAKDVARVAVQRASSQLVMKAAEAAQVIRAVTATGILLDRCAACLASRSSEFDIGELATTIVALGEKAFDGSDLAAACRELASRRSSFSRLPPFVLLSLAVAAAKTPSLAECIGDVVVASVATLESWSAADAIKLLLAVVKAKGDSIPRDVKGDLLRDAAMKIAPSLGELPAAELVRLALAAGQQRSSRSADADRLLEAVAAEAVRRVSDLPQAHLLLLTQGLSPLGGGHKSLRQICSFWGEILGDSGGGDSGDEVSKRRKDMERGQSLPPDQLVKLTTVLQPLARDLDEETVARCFSAASDRLADVAGKLSDTSRATLLDQIRRGEGVGSCESGREKLRRKLERGKSRSRSRSRKRSRSRSRSRGGRRSDSRRRRSRSDSRRRRSRSRGRGRRK
eukprot:TRINITY_DN27530_c0_g1_i1.p1 TRINITY_DN27530_c0_g1~~TRINITY_DN27530_c0_g1_i1.p1  ORF type:complete len:1263 (+),score=214.78 TRINITY_DN27530_c0_g1_i1:33-3791(+)